MRLISWNVLADAYVRASYYPATDPALLQPGARTAAILDVIAASAADVVCLQEVTPPLVDAARTRLGGWTIHFVAKLGRPDGCAIIARPAVMLDELETLVFRDGAPDRDDSGHIAALARLRVGDRTIHLLTTHLRWDPPGRSRDQRWAIREVSALLPLLDRPAVLCGDFNFEPDDDAYRVLLDSGLVDPHAHDQRPTSNANGRAKRIDYILHTRDLQSIARTTPHVAADAPLPVHTMPSDHVPIAVDLDV